MMWGLIARADDRGLGHLTWEMARNLRPDRILVVDMCDERFPTKRWRYDGLATQFEIEWRYPDFTDRCIDEFLSGLDVVFSAETFYGLDQYAYEHDVKTINYVMPEFYRRDEPQPTELWLPTTWLSEFIPFDRIMPLPCPTDRWHEPTPYRGTHEQLRVVMPAGNSAMHDRNGAKIFMRALRYVHEPMTVTAMTQDRAFPIETRMAEEVEYSLQRYTENYWDICRDAHLVVIPRKYGGLCLPAIEALGAGAVLAMSDCNPNQMWPIEPISARPSSVIDAPFGAITMWECEARDIAMMLDHFASDSEMTRERQQESREWAHENSWINKRDSWRDAIESVGAR